MSDAPDGRGGDGAGGTDADGVPVELDGVSVAFDGVAALRDASVSIEPGEFFTLVGPSGCGKTTTLRTIAGFEAPTTGTVRIDGSDVAGRPPEDRDVGVVFQSYALFPTMTVRENVGYGLDFRDPPDGSTRTARVDDLLDLVDMAGLGDRDPETLSGGQRQRVALARALAPGPSVLLLDEPLSALDARLRERLRVTIRRIQRRLGTTTVYVTHDRAEALAVSDRVAVLSDGAVEQVGTPETVYRRPASRFVATFVGDTTLLDGTMTATDPPRARLDAGDGTTATLRLPPGDYRPGERVTACVRPEVIDVVDAPTPVTDRDRTVLDATVTGSEFLGDAYRLHCAWGGTSIQVRLPATGRTAAPTGRVRLAIDAAELHVL